MCKKIILVAFFPLLLMAALPALADVGSDLQEAETHVKRGNYAAAEQIYVQIAADHPGTEHAFAAQRKLAYIYITMDQPVEAQAAFAKMLTDFAGHERLPHAIHEIAENCNKLSKADKARELCRNTLDSGLFAESAIWLQMGIAVSNAYCGNDAAADAAIEQLIRDFSADSRAAEGVGQTAWAYRKLQRHDRARVLYQYVVDNWPDNERAIFSQRGIILTSIALDNEEKPDSATEKLLTNFSQDKRLPKVILDIVGVYRGKGDYEKSRTLAQYIVDNYPQSSEAIWAQQQMILACIGLDDDPNTEAGIDALFSKSSSHKDIAKAVYGTARKLNWKDDATAEQLYQYIADNHPDDEHAILAQANLGQIALRLGDERGARAVFDQMLVDFASHPLLVKAVALMAEGYWDLAMFETKEGMVDKATDHFSKAVVEYQRIIQELPGTPYTTAQAHYLAGEYYRRFGQYEKAIDHYNAIIGDWPKCEFAGQAQFMVGRVYQYVKSSGEIAKEEADNLIRTAYDRVLLYHWDSHAAGAARNRLRNDRYMKQSAETVPPRPNRKAR